MRSPVDQVERVEALAQLARLGVAEVDAVADGSWRGGLAQQRRLHLARALEAVEVQAGGQVGRRDAARLGGAGGEVAAAEHASRSPGAGLRTTGSANIAAGRRRKDA